MGESNQVRVAEQHFSDATLSSYQRRYIGDKLLAKPGRFNSVRKKLRIVLDKIEHPMGALNQLLLRRANNKHRLGLFAVIGELPIKFGGQLTSPVRAGQRRQTFENGFVVFHRLRYRVIHTLGIQGLHAVAAIVDALGDNKPGAGGRLDIGEQTDRHGNGKIRRTRQHRKTRLRNHHKARPVPQLVVEVTRELDEQPLGQRRCRCFVGQCQQQLFTGAATKEFLRLDDALYTIVGGERPGGVKRPGQKIRTVGD